MAIPFSRSVLRPRLSSNAVAALVAACSFFSSQTFCAVNPSPERLNSAAEYYFSRNDFAQAYELWGQVIHKQPDNLGVLLKYSDLKLMHEGREAAVEGLAKYYQTHADSLEADALKLIREKWFTLRSLFLTDEGQSGYLQGKQKIRRKDWASALSLLTQAASVEKGNFLVLKDKARCERALGLHDQSYETLKVAQAAYPSDGETVDLLSEQHLFHKDYTAVVTLASQLSEMPESYRHRLALGVSLFETGDSSGAISILQDLLQKQRGVHPIAHLTLAKALRKRQGTSLEAVTHLNRFLQLAPRVSTDWDPYRTAEQIEPAKKLLADLRRT